MSDERRRWKRLYLKLIGKADNCAVLLDEKTLLNCTLINVSCGGAKVRIKLKDEKAPHIMGGQRVQFKSFVSDKYDLLTGKKGIASWYNAAALEFGISFNEIVPKHMVETLT